MIMKKTINICLALFSAILFMAASNGKGASEIYEMIESKSGDSFSMSVNKDFEDFFDMDMDLNGSEKWVKGDFKSGRFLVVDKEEVKDLKIIKEFKDRGYFMTKVEDEDEDEDGADEELYVFTDVKGEDIHEVHFFLLGDEKVVLMSIYGDIHLEKK
ncbi:MAG: hypothetical protein CMP59_02335 [Flavobacteriales bacterium]|nr:hypothetical protein [Flavobacteriales bacterium]|tara:strand:+ start:1415 stop:1885 length:471 start_codon:yes stop_codon:yes gene_type:complete